MDNLKIEHNTRNIFYKNPFGALTTEQSAQIRLAISGAGIPNSVKIFYINKDKETNSFNMPYVNEVCGFCIYEANIPPQHKCGNIWYYFEVVTSDGIVYYGNNAEGLGGIGKIYENVPDKLFQITIYSADYQTPNWWKNSVCYQIFCDRFFNGNEDGTFNGKRNDIIKHSWGDEPFYQPSQFGGEYLANDFFGGNLKGIMKKLEYLSQLGISSVYLNPIFKAFSNHKYDTGDYMKIDEMFGTEEDFKNLCNAAEKYGIRIILDGVFNHTGSDSKYFNKKGNYPEAGAYQSESSKYFEWYNFKKWNTDYESWWGMLTLPQVNEKSLSYQNYILKDDDSVVKHWLKAGAYGWRLDVVDELPEFFVKILHDEVKKQNPEAVIIGEVWEDASNKVSYGEEREYFLGNSLDSVMNYPMREALILAVMGKITAEELDERLMSLKENYPKPAYYSLLNMISTHDTERILTALSGAPDRKSISREEQARYHIDGELLKKSIERVKQIVIMQMLMPGVPCIYYGDEAGLQGYGDPFCRNTYPWGNENQDLLNWYKSAIALRKGSRAYVEGEFETIYKVGNAYAFIRYKNDDKHVVVANFSDVSVWVRLDLARFDIHSLNSELEEEYYSAEDGIFYIEIQARGVKVFDGKTKIRQDYM